MPQPIDFPTEAGRISAAERIQQIADRASLAGQQHARATEEDKRVQQETQVRDTHRGEQDALDADGRNPQERRESKRRAHADRSMHNRRPDAADLPVIPEDDAPHFDVKL